MNCKNVHSAFPVCSLGTLWFYMFQPAVQQKCQQTYNPQLPRLGILNPAAAIWKQGMAAGSVHSQTSLHHWWCSENVLIIQFFQISLLVPTLFLPVCLAQSVPGHGAVCVWWPSTDPVRPRAPWAGWMAAGWATSTVSPLHSPSHAALPELPMLLIPIHSPIHDFRLMNSRCFPTEMGARRFFFPPEKCCPFFRLCFCGKACLKL